MTAGITQADRAGWQRQAVCELAAVLDAHSDLPVIAWTVGPAGSVVAGRVSGLGPAARVRDVFDAWRAALALADYRERPGAGGTVYLQAGAWRGGVKIRLAGVVLEEGGW